MAKFRRDKIRERNKAQKHPKFDSSKLEKLTRKYLDSWLEESEELRSQVYHAPELGDLDALDAWQLEAYNSLEEGCNVIVDAPTTAGKTRVVETFFAKHVEEPEFRAAYTTPVKSLSNDKLREFRELFGRERVGIATGDIKENLGAPIIVTTLETYRNSLLGVEPDLGRRLVIFDEYHFMQDDSRGSAWEEAIILTPENCQLLMLSASVANARDFCDWLEMIHKRRTVIVKTEKRPVPLMNLVYYRNRWLLADEIPRKLLPKPPKALIPMPHRHLADRLISLVDLNLCPCIAYAGRRKSVESLALELAKIVPALKAGQKSAINKLLEEENRETKALELISPRLKHIITEFGIAYHHSGLASPVRLAIERCLKNGELRFCTATMGLSLGINFSVRSAVITDYQRPGEGGFSKYSTSEVMQMLGRAGRRGQDVVGFSVWPNTDGFQKLSKGKREKCTSRLKNDPTTFLGLVAQGFGEKALEMFYNRSFLRFHDKGVDLSLVRKSRVSKKLGENKLPCRSPAHAFSDFVAEDKQSPCFDCPHKNPCHKYLDQKCMNDLAALQVHLHYIGALDENEKLTPYGETAKYFPQAGGLLFARFLADGSIKVENLGAACQLIAALATARFKTPFAPKDYEFGFDLEELEEQLEEYYPIELFPELYDPPYGKRDYDVLREFNPAAGYAVKLWMSGVSWAELQRRITNPKFAAGDLMSLLYRVATYLQSLSQARLGEISYVARDLREEMLREPLSITL